MLFASAFFAGDILKNYARIFRIDDASKGADCVIILSGNPKTRPDQAALLVRHGYADLLLHTDQKRWNERHTELLDSDFEISQKILGTYNIRADIIPSTKGGATSTFDEAYDFVSFLKSHPFKRVILVTDSYHTARARFAFRKVLDRHGYTDLKIEMSAAPNDIFNEDNWYTTEAGISAYMLEPIKYLFYIFNTSNSNLIKEN